MKNKKEFSLKVLFAFEAVIGIIILISAFIFESNNVVHKAGKGIQDTVQSVKELCNAGEIRDMASEAKSLMQATESVKQIRHSINCVDTALYDNDSEMWKALAEDNYLDGVMLLDEEGNIKAGYGSSDIGGEKLLDKIKLNELLDTIVFPEKIYNVRIQMEEGGHIDLAAAGTADHKNIIVGYFLTSSAYESIINNPITAIVNGFNLESSGCVVISDGTEVIYANDISLIGKKIEDVEILNAINERGSGTELVYAKSEANSFDYQFGLMDKSRKYSIYVFMDKKDFLPSMLMYSMFVLSIYLILIVIADIILWRNHLHYEKEKSATKQNYMKELEDKNSQLEKALEQAREASQAKTTFLSNMSHDIRTPINGIVGLLKINQDHFDDIELVKGNYKKMQIAADHLLSLINDVLQMSKIEDGNVTLGREFIDFKNLSGEINSIIGGRASEYGISLDFKMDRERSYPCVYGSPVHLREIFLNIYGNCIKYNHPGGKITTAVDIIEETDSSCTYQWTIEDTGIGMNEEFVNHIFEPFSQEKSDARTYYQGVGLGMSIVKGLLDEMGGKIAVSSKEGVGTTFIITIPFEIASDERKEKNISEKDSDITGFHLLLAEDNELNAEIAEVMLTDQGAIMTLVADGQQAVDMFNKKPAGTFDAILMDIMMPVMDGLTATKQIRELNRPDAKTIPIIAMTANAFEEDKKKSLDAGMNAHLAKPLDIETVKNTLCKFIGKK